MEIHLGFVFRNQLSRKESEFKTGSIKIAIPYPYRLLLLLLHVLLILLLLLLGVAMFHESLKKNRLH